MTLPSPLVLVFDRDAGTRAWYRGAFVSTGYRVAEAADGTEALEFLTNRVPDLIITELRPDHRDGLTLGVIKRLNAATADIPIVMMMRDADPDVKAAALLVGAGTLLDRPASSTAVLVLANQLILATPLARVTRRHLYRTLADLKDATESQLPTTMSTALSSVLLADGQAKCVAVNAAACHLTGYSAAELLALSVWDLARPDAHERARMLWGRFLVNGECAGEFLTVQKDGAEVTIQLCAMANIAPGLHAIVVGRTPLEP
jgi:PAS domain S-box-containing protein